MDASSIGLEKARRLAEERGVVIETVVDDLARFRPVPASFDAVIAIFAHLPPAARAHAHAASEMALAPGGVIIVEAFSPRQLGRPSGGPKQAELLYDPETLRADFQLVSWDVLEEAEVDLEEGELDRGRAAVVRGAGRRADASSPRT